MAKISRIDGQIIGQDRKAYLGICQMLFNNELYPGQKIANKDLAQRLGVSTTPVIHALKLLELKGITRREANRGYFINSITIQEVEEIFDARIALEVSLLDKTLKWLDQAALKRLEDALKLHDEAVAQNDPSRRVMTDLRFHMTLASLSRTEIQVTLLEDLFDRLLLKYSKDIFRVSIIETSQKEHYAILDAIKKKDLGLMTEALTCHLKQTKTRIMQGLSESLDENGSRLSKYHSFEDIKDKTNF
jgi:DNA-binding GntR family transcriptional regulator